MFCGSLDPGENIKNCKKRQYLQRISKEFTIGRNGDNLDDFRRKVEFDHVFSSHTTVPTEVYTELGRSKGKQIFVHQIWRPLFATTLSQFQFNDMILEISYINQEGDIEKNKVAVTGKSLHSLLCARNGASKLSFLFDGSNSNTNRSTDHAGHHINQPLNHFSIRNYQALSTFGNNISELWNNNFNPKVVAGQTNTTNDSTRTDSILDNNIEFDML